MDALNRKGRFTVIESKTAWKADLIILKGRPFSQREFLRKTRANVLGVPLEIVSAEDLVLAKLEWAAEGGSKRPIEDAAGVLRTGKEKLDRDYLGAGVKELGLDPEWAQARALAGLSAT